MTNVLKNRAYLVFGDVPDAKAHGPIFKNMISDNQIITVVFKTWLVRYSDAQKSFNMTYLMPKHMTYLMPKHMTYLMPKHMNPFVFLGGESLVTDLADVGLLTRVQPEMGRQWLVLLEGHAADVARERVVLQVTVRVVLLLNLEKIRS